MLADEINDGLTDLWPWCRGIDGTPVFWNATVSISILDTGVGHDDTAGHKHTQMKLIESLPFQSIKKKFIK